ncbi:MAG: hypothetical protein WCV90_01610 [Candidatus Woesearchaeota archaeon]|jgi:dihydroorotate dehydrogenase
MYQLVSALDYRLRPYFSSLSPEQVVKTYSLAREWYLDLLHSTTPLARIPLRVIEVNGLTFRSDLGNAAGFDKNGEMLRFNYFLGAGFGLVGTVLEQENKGNLINAYGHKVNPWTPLPNSHSAINSLGLPSKGIDYVVERVREFKEKYSPEDFPIGLSLSTSGSKDYFKKALSVADFIELNPSCPNVCHQEVDLNELVGRLKEIRDVPLFVKLRSFDDKYLIDGVDGLVLTNTQIDYSNLRKNLSPKDHALFDYYTQKYKGGISGEAIKEVSLREMRKAREYLDEHSLNLNLIHVGGISAPEDVQESRKYARLRQWYTGLMNSLATIQVEEIYEGMLRLC